MIESNLVENLIFCIINLNGEIMTTNNMLEAVLSVDVFLFVLGIFGIGWYIFLQEKRHQQLKDWIFKGIQFDASSLKIIELAEDYWKIRYKFENDRSQFKVRDFERMDRKFKNLFQIELIDYTNRNYNEGLNLKVLVTRDKEDLPYPYAPRIGKTIRPEIRFNGAVISKSEVEVYERKLVDPSQVPLKIKLPVPDNNPQLTHPIKDHEDSSAPLPTFSEETTVAAGTPVDPIKPTLVVESPDKSENSTTIKKE